MKTTLLTIAVIALCCMAMAAEYWIPNPPNVTAAYTNVPVFNSTTNGTYTNYQGASFSTFHTFQVNYICLGTNVCTNYFDATIDFSTNSWVPVTNFSFSASGGAIFQANGKFFMWRIRSTILSTNQTPTNEVFYLAQ